jgi:gliding motility-associated-like protein
VTKTAPRSNDRLVSPEGESVVANDDLIRMNENDTYDTNVMNNDLGLTSGIASLTIITLPEYGSAWFGDDQRLYYQPETYYIGEDYLEYEVCNSDGNCATASVYITVNDYDFQPECVDDTVCVNKGVVTEVDILENDLYLYDLDLTVEISQMPENGTAYLNSSQTLEIEITNFSLEQDSLIYQVCDAEGDCDEGKVIISLITDGDTFYIPEGFSPNGDGINDTFNIPEFDEFTNRRITIMDRNGYIIYQTNQYENNWDGRGNKNQYNGSLCPAGVYYYRLEISDLDQIFTGYIYLNR